MIRIDSTGEQFVYDIVGLVKAFYPKEEIKFSKGPLSELFCLKIQMSEQKICVSLWDGEKKEIQKEKESKETERKTYRNDLKIVLYQVLAEKSGKQLPWGTLTGVRPTKLPMEHLEHGKSETEIIRFMKEQYLCSEEKIQLSMTIAKKELELLHNVNYKNGYSIYIGIPFCPSRCFYCSFTSYPLDKHKQMVEPYLEALFQEIDFAANEIFTEKELTTLYIGGGTPTTLTEGQLGKLLEKVTGSFPMTQVKEFTVEAGRPDSITREKLEILKRYGVTRISINPQTMNQCTLDAIGRKHTVEEVVETFKMARETGHDNINMDLIAGLPGEDPESMKDTLEQLHALNPDSITVHSLVIKRAAQLNLEQGKEIKNGLYDTKNMLELTAQYAKENNYEPYYMYRQKNATGNDAKNQENIGYARNGKEGIYNVLIMEEKQSILALGAGASSKFVFPSGGRIERVENVKSIKDYIERIGEMIQRKRDFLQKNKELFSLQNK